MLKLLKSEISRSAFILISFALLLAGCKYNSSYNLYASDIMSLGSGAKQVIYTQAKGAIDIGPNDKACKADIGTFADTLKSYYKDVSSVTCDDSGMDDYIRFLYKEPVMTIEAWNASSNLSGLVVAKKDGDVMALLAFRKSKYRSLKDHLQKEIDPNGIDDDSLSIGELSFDVINDMPKTIIVNSYSAYINGKPMMHVDVPLNRHDSVTITNSNVANDYLIKHQHVFILALKEDPKNST